MANKEVTVEVTVEEMDAALVVLREKADDVEIHAATAITGQKRKSDAFKTQLATVKKLRAGLKDPTATSFGEKISNCKATAFSKVLTTVDTAKNIKKQHRRN